MNVSNTAALTTMNRINDQTMPELKFSLPDFRLSNLDTNEECNDSLDWMSQLLSNSKTSETCRSVSKERRADDDSDDMNVELDLDFGEDENFSIKEGACMSTERDVINGGMKFSNANNMCPNFEEGETQIRGVTPNFLDGVTSPGSDNEATMLNSQAGSQTPSLSVYSSISRKKERVFKVKKRSIIPNDVDTVIPITRLKQQQLNRTAILKPVSSLSRNPMLFGLMKMQREGGFVSNIMHGDRVKEWAPEIRGLLSIDVMERLGELKRKRESGIVDEEELQSQFESPNEEEGSISGNEGLFEDDTTVCGLMEQGVISLDTQHAVHLLRGCFKSSQGDDSSTLFQKLLPETMTSKADATRMFFEVLVLATKSAVTVEQPDGQLDGPIRIQEKRGLWGFRAEEEAEVNICRCGSEIHDRLRDSGESNHSLQSEALFLNRPSLHS